MKRSFALFLAAALCLVPAGCRGPAEPESSSPLSPTQSGSPSPEPDPEPEPVPEPEPEPEEPDFAPAPGVECRVLLTRPGMMSYAKPVFAKGGRAVIRLEEQVLGINMETGEIGFQRSIPPDNEVYEVPSAPGAFRLVDKSGFTQYAWTQRGLEKGSVYPLPQTAREAGKQREFFRGKELWWDALPDQDLLTWADAEGIWLSAADGSDPYLVVSTEAVSQRPEYESYMEEKQARLDEPVERKDCLFLGCPRLMNKGRTLVLPIYNRVSLYYLDDILTVDLATGEQRLYWGVITGKNKDTLWFLDDTTILAGYTLIDLASGTTQEILHSGIDDMMDNARSSDFVHFLFGMGQGERWEYRLFTRDTSDERLSFPMDTLWESGQTLFTCPMDHSPSAVAIDGTRFLFICPAAEGEISLLLVTAPET